MQNISWYSHLKSVQNKPVKKRNLLKFKWLYNPSCLLPEWMFEVSLQELSGVSWEHDSGQPQYACCGKSHTCSDLPLGFRGFLSSQSTLLSPYFRVWDPIPSVELGLFFFISLSFSCSFAFTDILMKRRILEELSIHAYGGKKWQGKMKGTSAQ